MNKQTKQTTINRQKRDLIDHVAWCIRLKMHNKADWWNDIGSELDNLYEYYVNQSIDYEGYLLDVDTIHELIYDHFKWIDFDANRIEGIFGDPSLQETDQKQEVEA